MLFNSLDFAVFLPIVFVLYWFVFNKQLKLQNLLLLVASYVFYGWWDWKFLSLIFFSSVLDFLIGQGLEKENSKIRRKILLLASIVVNIGLLGFFKYYNFFLENFIDAFSFFGQKFDARPLNIILPVGISFYTFQTLSYSIDVYKRKLKPTKDIVSFFAFVSFFPQLVAGPIERASNLLPQFYSKRSFDERKSIDGVYQIIWGLFKKMVIADNAAVYVNDIFSNYTSYNSSTLLLGSVLFAFQIYGDFSGYSDIAIGTSRLFGFSLMRNFAFPYFSRDIAEFWRRWHISLSSWFRDYIYLPLGGSKGGINMKIRNTFVIFIISGFWHGANWTFIVWGALNAIFFLPLMLVKKNRKNLEIVAFNSKLPSLRELLSIVGTFFLTCMAWIFFRSDNVISAFDYIYRIFTVDMFALPEISKFKMLKFSVPLFVLIFMEWINRKHQHGLEIERFPVLMQYVAAISIGLLIFFLKSFKGSDFIYFQF